MHGKRECAILCSRPTLWVPSSGRRTHTFRLTTGFHMQVLYFLCRLLSSLFCRLMSAFYPPSACYNCFKFILFHALNTLLVIPHPVELYLNDGLLPGGDRILPEGFVSYTATATKDSNGRYGAQWWLAGPGINRASIPVTGMFASGHDGQSVLVIPSTNTVIVRLGLTRSSWDREAFWNAILSILQ